MRAELLMMLLGATGSSACSARTPPVIVEQHERVDLTDGELARLMTTHHRAVMDIALMDGGRGKSAELKEFATTVWQSRSRDVPAWEALEGQLSDTAASHERQMLDAHRSIITHMKSADAAELDELVIREMLRLSQVAAEMIAQTTVSDPEIQKLAERFAETQQAELDKLDQLQRATSARR